MKEGDFLCAPRDYCNVWKPFCCVQWQQLLDSLLITDVNRNDGPRMVSKAPRLWGAFRAVSLSGIL
jgi:hypothetical protein